MIDQKYAKLLNSCMPCTQHVCNMHRIRFLKEAEYLGGGRFAFLYNDELNGEFVLGQPLGGIYAKDALSEHLVREQSSKNRIRQLMNLGFVGIYKEV
ncbi:MAG: hypothetical protein HZB65_03425 [Candidatus Aenigmarchaeota archaeon]|nr:hypothetical protein [Candidatus Aenigmarchaeota archaeon]